MSTAKEHLVNLEKELSLFVSESHITDPAVFTCYSALHDAMRNFRTSIEQSKDNEGEHCGNS